MVSVLGYAITFVLVFSLIVFIVLFGPHPRFRNTPIAAANKVLTKDIPWIVNSVDRMLTGGRVGYVCGYIFSPRTPLIMIAYLILMTGGIFIFFAYTWKNIPGPAVASIHWWLVLLAVPTPYISLYVLSVSDPGIITPQNHEKHLQLFPYDNIIFTPGVLCPTCNFTKPARSKHCSACNVCVARHDHHCVWIGNCVGYSNTHLFVLFLMVNTSLLAYGAYLHYLIFSHRVAQIRLLQRQTIASFGSALHYVRLRSTSQLWWSAIIEAELGGALFLICIMICIVTTAFLLHHLWLLSSGTTTNESFKWADVKDALSSGIIVVLDQDDEYMRGRKSRIIPLDPPMEDEEPETPREEAMRLNLVQNTERGARQWKQIDNVYASESKWRNLVDGIRGGHVEPMWERPRRRWFKRKA